MTRAEHDRRYSARLKLRLYTRHGNKCEYCGIENGVLEFAHLEYTKVIGKGRGRNARYLDVLRHFEFYALLCGPQTKINTCHYKLDHGLLPKESILRVRQGELPF